MARAPTANESPALTFEGVAARHPGLTDEVWDYHHQAACVCLDRHHAPPQPFDVRMDDARELLSVTWVPADAAARRAWANSTDATECGAYAVTIACAERVAGLFVVSRADVASGADWYVAPYGCGVDGNGDPDLDALGVRRFEVSGVDVGPVGARLTEKKRQLLEGHSDLPGIAAVVGFERAVVAMESTPET